MANSNRYEINHEGEIVIHDSALCNNLDNMLIDLFSQFGWKAEIIEKEGSCRHIRLKNVNGNIENINVYSGTIRNEARNPYEKKIQLGSNNNPKTKSKKDTVIIGVYVFDKFDSISDAIFVGYPIDDSVNYETNPSLRGTFVNQLLIDTKNNGFVYDKTHNTVGFLAPFVFYYLNHHYDLHYNSNKYYETCYETIDNVSETENEPLNICYKTSCDTKGFSQNRILFGAPGTGKSYTLNKEKDILLENGGAYERVTFYPDYSYANFVGTYKPVPFIDQDGKESITYSYVPGPFMRTYVEALKSARTEDPKPYLLIIEEINRANVASVFGDIFQLLDRDGRNISEYPIQTSEDIKNYLAKPENLGGSPQEYNEIRLPDNLFIWATMNSADQGVFPLDTAFKRRWDFTYLGIDEAEKGIVGKKVVLGKGNYARVVEWNELRKAINSELLKYNLNEDKLLGPYFISKKDLPDDDNIDAEQFSIIFKNKVIMYLFDDAAKQKRKSLFSGCKDSATQYSKICNLFDDKGVFIFDDNISSQFIERLGESES